MAYYDRRVNAPRAKRSTLFSASERLMLSQGISGWWGNVLTPAEDKVLSFIFARTIGWGREWEVITLRHFMEGIVDRSAPGARHTHGTGLTKPTVCKVLATLEGEGFLSRRAYGNTHQYRIRIETMGRQDDPVLRRRQAHEMAQQQQQEFRVEKAARLRRLWREFNQTRDLAVMQAARELQNTRVPRRETLVAEALEVLKVLPPNKEHNPLAKANGAQANACLAPGGRKRQEDGMALPTRRNKTDKTTTPTQEDDTGTSLPEGGTLPTKRHRPRPVPRIRQDADDNLQTPALLDAARRDLAERGTQGQEAPTAGEDAPEPPKPAVGRTEAMLAASAVVRDSRARTARRRKETLRAKGPSVSTVREAWNSTHVRTYGQTAAPWNGKMRGRLRHLLDSYAVNHADVTWLDVVEWYVGDFARAVSFAVPFMLRTRDQRESLLHAMPSPTLVVHFAGEFLSAYLRLHYGEGYTEADHNRADDAHRVHVRWCERQEHVRYHGQEAIPTDLRTTGELIDHALASDTPEVQQQVRAFTAFEQLIQDVNAEGGTARDVQEAQQAAQGELERQARDAAFAQTARAMEDDIVAAMRETYPDMGREEALALHREMMEEGEQ